MIFRWSYWLHVRKGLNSENSCKRIFVYKGLITLYFPSVNHLFVLSFSLLRNKINKVTLSLGKFICLHFVEKSRTITINKDRNSLPDKFHVVSTWVVRLNITFYNIYIIRVSYVLNVSFGELQNHFFLSLPYHCCRVPFPRFNGGRQRDYLSSVINTFSPTLYVNDYHITFVSGM